MFLDCKQLFDIPGETVAIDYKLDLSDYELFSSKPFQTPVQVKGMAENRAGIVSLNMNCSFVLSLSCDRCLEEFKKTFSYDFSHILVQELHSDEADENDYIVVEEHKLDLKELALSDILLSLPTKNLCKEDCKGLCPMCGKNLNTDTCECSQKQVDPRLEKLGELLK